MNGSNNTHVIFLAICINTYHCYIFGQFSSSFLHERVISYTKTNNDYDENDIYNDNNNNYYFFIIIMMIKHVLEVLCYF